MKKVNAHYRKTARGGALVRIKSYVARAKSTGVSRNVHKPEIIQPFVKVPIPPSTMG